MRNLREERMRGVGSKIMDSSIGCTKKSMIDRNKHSQDPEIQKQIEAMSKRWEELGVKFGGDDTNKDLLHWRRKQRLRKFSSILKFPPLFFHVLLGVVVYFRGYRFK
jgi:hypothetical protein